MIKTTIIPDPDCAKSKVFYGGEVLSKQVIAAEGAFEEKIALWCTLFMFSLQRPTLAFRLKRC
jgi:hypothetical protein